MTKRAKKIVVVAELPARRPNMPALRSAFVAKWRVWVKACAAEGITDLYLDAAEGRMIGRGKNKKPDAIRAAFIEMEDARLAYLGAQP